MCKLVLLLALISLPLQASAQHVVTRKTTTKQKTESKPTAKRQPSAAKSQSNRSNSNAKPMTEEERVIKNIIKNMVFVEGGTFTMGATPEQGGDANDKEKPAHQVTLSSFYISKYEVTQHEWQVIMGNNPASFKGNDMRPVDGVSVYDCHDFIKKLNDLTGYVFRLPTEAEWEYAARGGKKSRGYKYAGSNNVDEVAWYDATSGDQSHPVGKKKPNELGLYDMSGNVFEWCEDYYGDYTSEPQTNPKGATYGMTRICRGGRWLTSAEYCRVSDREEFVSNYSYGNGLRLAFTCAP